MGCPRCGDRAVAVTKDDEIRARCLNPECMTRFTIQLAPQPA